MQGSSRPLAVACAALGSLLSLLSTTSAAVAADDYYLGAERLMGLYWQRQSAEIEEGNVNQETSLHTTSVGVLALQGATPSSVPRLAFDAFLTETISVGGSFIYSTSSQSVVFSAEGNSDDQEDDLGSRSVLGLAPRVGYRLEFDDEYGLWPRAGFMFARDKTTSVESTQPSVERETSSSTLSLTLDAMFYASPIHHVVLLGGPFLDLGMLYGSYSEKTTGGTSTDGDAKLTAFGLAFGLGVVF